MKIIEFAVDSNEIEIVPCADWHIGSPQSDEVLIKEICDYIANTPNCYTILNGDILDNNIRNSIGSGVFEQTMSPANQVSTATYYLRPIAEKGKIINMVSGNHELRNERETGISLSQLLLANLMKYDESLNERYSEDGAFTFLTLNGRKQKEHKSKVCFTMFNLHGSGSSTKIGNKIQRLDDMQSVIPNAHIYVRSHTHVPETHRGVVLNVYTNTHTVREEGCVFVNTGSALKYNGGYGARAGMKPLSRGIPVIRLKAVRKNKSNKEDIYYRQTECVIKESLYEC